MGNDFVHLHLHTEYSLLDGACRIRDLPAHVKSLGQTAVAITDHGCMYGVIEFYHACKKEGIRPIIGCEVYVAPRTRFDKVHGIDTSPFHLVLLCENMTGYQNLIKLVSAGYIDGFYNKPRIDFDLLRMHSEGLICLSACLAGEIPRRLTAGDYAGAKEAALRYASVFPAGNYFLEIQNHELKEQQKILPMLIRLSKETGIPLVLTNDAHYLKKEDARIQNVLVCIQTNHVVGEENSMAFETEEFYVKSGEEMARCLEAFPEAIAMGALENTVRIAERCQVDFSFGQAKLPAFHTPDGSENSVYFRRLCQEGLRRIYGKNPSQELQERLAYEIDVIVRMGYVDYYLIVQDYIQFAKDRGIPVGPGRGSGAASLAAYCIGITGIDPIRYNLVFERFLNPERVSMPDFDVDFCYERRQEVLDYVVEKYGSDHVVQIVTFGTMAARAAIRDVGRALGISYQTVDQVAKMVPYELNITIAAALQASAKLREQYMASPQIKELIDTAAKLEGMPRHTSIHAAGVVITADPAVEYVPLAKSDDAIITQYEWHTLEELGLVKMDFLGLRNLTIIREAEKNIQKTDPSFQIKEIPMDAPDVYAMLGQGATAGVFQMESGGIKQLLMQLKPEGFEDIIAVISLYRPGPMESIPTYVRNRHNPALVTFKHPLLQPILDVTYGVIVYQEQVMQICTQLAGYSYGRADLVRRAMAKKKADVMEKERQNFIYGKKNPDGSVECPGAVANGVPPDVAEDIFDEMAGFASYAFNKAHAAAYALIVYQTAFLKCRYPREYMAALLTSVLYNNDKVIEYIGECKKLGIRILPPDINESDAGFTVSGKDIRFGLVAVKGVGKGLIDGVIRERQQKPFTSLYDFCERMSGKDLNKRTLEGLIQCGAFDSFPNNRREMLHVYAEMLDFIENKKRTNVSGQINLFGGSLDMGQTEEFHIQPLAEFPLEEMIRMEKETVGLYISAHPLDAYKDLLEQYKFVPIEQIVSRENASSAYHENDRVTVMGVVISKKVLTTRASTQMAFITLEDLTGTVEIVVFPNVYANSQSYLQEGKILVIDGTVSVKENEPESLVCSRLYTPESYAAFRKAAAEKKKEESEAAVSDRPTDTTRLFLRCSSEQQPLLDQIAAVLKKYPGSCPVVLYFEREQQYKKLPQQFSVLPSALLTEELAALVGPANVVLR